MPTDDEDRIWTGLHLPLPLGVPNLGLPLAASLPAALDPAILLLSICPDDVGDPCVDLENLTAATQAYLLSLLPKAVRDKYALLMQSVPSPVRNASKAAAKKADRIVNDFVTDFNKLWAKTNQKARDEFGPGYSVDFSVAHADDGYQMVARLTLRSDRNVNVKKPTVAVLNAALEAL